MTALESMVQIQAGHIAALILVAQALVAKHHDRAAFAAELRELADSDFGVILAMSAAGMPKVDATFRSIVEKMIALAEQPAPPATRFRPFGTGS